MASPVSRSGRLLFALIILLSPFSYAMKDISLDDPYADLVPFPMPENSPGGKSDGVMVCERARVLGLPRLNLKSYANALHVVLKPSDRLPERFHNKIGICFHRNASKGLCDCANDEWMALENKQWSKYMSPYGDKYIDVRFTDGLMGSATLSLEQEQQQWRLVFLVIGILTILAAPILCQWVPFYYSSSMILGVLAVVLILLFQAMKLLPTGKKSAFYLAIYGSLVGVGSFIVHYFSMAVNSILESFGLSQEMHNPVSVFLFVGIVLAGAALGYWLVRKYILSDDGTVDIGVSQFVKWAMRLIGVVFIFQSSNDTPLAMAAVATSITFCGLVSHVVHARASRRPKGRDLWKLSMKNASSQQKRVEFLNRSPNTGYGSGRAISPVSNQRTPNGHSSWVSSPVRGLVSPSSRSASLLDSDFYSSYHKSPASRRRYSKKEWEDFTRESTREAMREWASSPEFTEWMIEHSDRIHITPEEEDSDSIASGSDSSDETAVEGANVLGLFKW